MSARTITLLVAIFGMLGTLAAALTDPSATWHLSAAQAVLVSSIGAGAYALARTFQKAKAGDPIKKLLSTSEAKGAVIVYGSSVLTAVVGLVPPQYAALASGIVTMLVGAARMWVPKTDGGGAGGIGPFSAALVLFGFLTLSAGVVRADTGTATNTSTATAVSTAVAIPEAAKWSWGPSVAAAVGAISLADGSYTVGPNAIPLGACLGITYLPIDTGVDGCFNLQLSNNNPNRYFPSVMIHAKKYFQAGIGLMAQQKSDASGLFYQWLVLVGGRYGFAGG